MFAKLQCREGNAQGISVISFYYSEKILSLAQKVNDISLKQTIVLKSNSNYLFPTEGSLKTVSYHDLER